MKVRFREIPIEIEREFNRIKREINNYILQKNSQIPPNTLFQKLDYEFEKIRKKYEEQDDQINLLHVEHNYLWSKAFQYLSNNPTESLRLIIQALSELLDRHELRSYSVNTFERMLSTYEVVLTKIREKKEFINFDVIENDFLNFIERFSTTAAIDSRKLTDVINILVNLFVKNHYDKKINELKITYPNIDESEGLADSIKSILNILKNISTKKFYIHSLCYESLYKLRKKQLHFLVRFVFFEKSEEKKQKAQKIIDIDRITKEMVNYSAGSLKSAEKFIKNLPFEKQNEEDIKVMITLKEIDKLTAEYFREAYSNKDILKAWHQMDKIKQFLVMKAFKENVSLSDNLVKYYSEEWSLLYVFVKICLLKDEVRKRTSSLSQMWVKDIFAKITHILETIEDFFKYEMKDKKDYTLKIMTSSFAGGFSEYFIHELCQEFFDYGTINENTPPEFKDLLECVKLVGNKEDIKLNDVLEPDKPDVDIHIKNKCAIFLKNSKIESDEMKKIWREIKLCEEKGITKIFYGINFIKNIKKIEYIRQSFEKIKKHYTDLNIDVFDIKDLVMVFLDELKRCGKSKLNFSHLALYKILDY